MTINPINEFIAYLRTIPVNAIILAIIVIFVVFWIVLIVAVRNDSDEHDKVIKKNIERVKKWGRK
jgi:hypothetical protein